MTLVFTDDAMMNHLPGEGHPERPQRLSAAVDAVRRLGHEVLPVSGAHFEDLVRAHDADYIDHLLSLEGESTSLDIDTFLSPGSVRAGLLAAGGVVSAVDRVVTGDDPRAFTLVRPPGHHATANTGMGFCLLNNVAVGATRALAEHGLDRVLIIDWDVHHGNGTEAIFYERGDVTVFNTHQYPFYPGTGPATSVGRGAGEGATVNAPLPAGATGADYAEVYERLLAPVARAVCPNLILVSAGFDAHIEDPLGGHQLIDDDYAWMSGFLADLADELCGGRLVLTLEGGYANHVLERCVARCVEVLDGGETRRPSGELSRCAGHIEEAIDVQRRYVPGLSAPSPSPSASLSRNSGLR